MKLAELAVKNMRSQFKHYLMYFVSMAFSVMVFYSFIAMSYNQTLLTRMAVSLNLSSALQAGSLMIVLFIFVFMYTANSFFLKRRKKEIGLYSLLGMRKFQIGLLFFMENMLIGLVALLVGIIGGIIFSKLFSMLLVKAMFLTIESDFSFSLRAILETTWMFLIVLGIVSFRSGHVVYRYKLVALFKGNQTADKRKPVTFFTWLMAFTGIALLSYGYYLARHFIDFILKLNDQLQSDMGMLVGLMLLLLYCISGTYLFFWGFLQIAIKGLQKIQRYYYRGINMVTTSSLSFHFKKNGTTLATVAVLSGTALAAISGATNVYSFGMKNINAEIPTDYIVSTEAWPQLESLLKQTKEHQLKDKLTVTYGVTGASFEKVAFNERSFYVGAVNVLKESAYQELKKLSPLIPDFSLSKKTDVAILDQSVVNVEVVKYLGIEKLNINNYQEPLKSVFNGADTLGGRGSTRYRLPTLIVTDALYQELGVELEYQLIYANIHNGENSEKIYEKVMEGVNQKVYTIEDGFQLEAGKLVGELTKESLVSDQNVLNNYLLIRQSIMPRYPSLASGRVDLGLLVYIAIFLGVVFLIATGSIIMLKQLSEAEEEKFRFQTLRKIGVSRAMICQSVYRQNLLVFTTPLLLAYLHAKYALVTMNYLIATEDTFLTWVARSLLLFIYFGFYLGTSKAYNRIVNGD